MKLSVGSELVLYRTKGEKIEKEEKKEDIPVSSLSDKDIETAKLRYLQRKGLLWYVCLVFLHEVWFPFDWILFGCIESFESPFLSNWCGPLNDMIKRDEVSEYEVMMWMDDSINHIHYQQSSFIIFTGFIIFYFTHFDSMPSCSFCGNTQSVRPCRSCGRPVCVVHVCGNGDCQSCFRRKA